MRIAFAFCLAAVAGCYNPEIPNNGFTCKNDPTCPDGYSCVGGYCVKSGGSPTTAMAIMIPKTGAPYSGSKLDPMLDTAAACPDANLEPNDGPEPGGHPLAFTPMPDMPTAKIVKLAICPTGPSPWTGTRLHDVDFFKVDNTTGPSSLSLMAQVFYDIAYGDLDIAIFDAGMHLLSADGTAVTNGCTAAMIGQGVYYVVVGGANNTDVNRYELLIRTFAAAHTCPSGGSGDGGT
jgi:hypothetical protein